MASLKMNNISKCLESLTLGKLVISAYYKENSRMFRYAEKLKHEATFKLKPNIKEIFELQNLIFKTFDLGTKFNQAYDQATIA